MKGKKADPSFISFFIQESVNDGATTPEEIVQRAKKAIFQIDDEIKAIEHAKATRSKLLDVIAAFEKPIKDKTEDAKILGFFKIRDQQRCKEICDLIKEHESLPTASLTDVSYNFCIKQLLETKVIMRLSDHLLRGERFNEYMTFVLRED
jgi:hypothetical protein